MNWIMTIDEQDNEYVKVYGVVGHHLRTWLFTINIEFIEDMLPVAAKFELKEHGEVLLNNPQIFADGYYPMNK